MFYLIAGFTTVLVVLVALCKFFFNCILYFNLNFDWVIEFKCIRIEMSSVEWENGNDCDKSTVYIIEYFEFVYILRYVRLKIIHNGHQLFHNDCFSAIDWELEAYKWIWYWRSSIQNITNFPYYSIFVYTLGSHHLFIWILSYHFIKLWFIYSFWDLSVCSSCKKYVSYRALSHMFLVQLTKRLLQSKKYILSCHKCFALKKKLFHKHPLINCDLLNELVAWPRIWFTKFKNLLAGNCNNPNV